MEFSISTHNGYVTVKSVVTGDHRTFRIATQPEDAKFAPNERIVSLLIGSDNENDYLGFGFLKTNGSGPRIVVWKRYRNGQYDRLARMLERLPAYEEAGKVEVNFDARCRRCNRVLTTPESVASGIGPVCEKRTGAK